MTCLLLASAALAAAGCTGGPGAAGGDGDTTGPPAGGPPRHLLLITVDTLRADHLSAYGYPRATAAAAERLAADGVLFDRAIAQWPKTGVSFASMFIGQYPQTSGLTHQAAIRVPDEYLTLPELMSKLGFTTVAVVSNAVLSDELGWNTGFDEYLQTWDLAPELSDDPIEYRRWIDASRVNELALPLLERHRDDERLFAWIHYSDPHAPYYLPPGVDNPFLGDRWYTGDEVFDPADLVEADSALLGDNRELRYYVAQYDANVRFSDQKIGELLDRAGELGIARDALVMLTADHGESLGEHGYYFGHGRKPYNQGARVPLIVSWPGGGVPRGARVTSPVELVDLYPTLLELLAPGRTVPGLEGESLLPLLRPGGEDAAEAAEERFRFAFSEAGGGAPTTHFRDVQDERWKLVYHPRLAAGRKTIPLTYELYDLAADPGETRDLAADPAHEDELRRMRKVLFEWMKGTDWIRRSRDQIDAQSEETLKALRALGYIE
jgi:arylsulfatase A-like enzyme